MKYCNACGMPLIKKEDFSRGNENTDFCLYCTNADGTVKSCEEIFEGGVKYFMSQFGNDRTLAEKVTRTNMTKQPYWADKDNQCLKGEMVTDEEFAEIVKKM